MIFICREVLREILGETDFKQTFRLQTVFTNHVKNIVGAEQNAMEETKRDIELR